MTSGRPMLTRLLKIMFRVTSTQEFETAKEAFEALTPATTEIKEINGEQEIVRSFEDLRNIVAEQAPESLEQTGTDQKEESQEEGAGEDLKGDEAGDQSETQEEGQPAEQENATEGQEENVTTGDQQIAEGEATGEADPAQSVE